MLNWSLTKVQKTTQLRKDNLFKIQDKLDISRKEGQEDEREEGKEGEGKEGRGEKGRGKGGRKRKNEKKEKKKRKERDLDLSLLTLIKKQLKINQGLACKT